MRNRGWPAGEGNVADGEERARDVFSLFVVALWMTPEPGRGPSAAPSVPSHRYFGEGRLGYLSSVDCNCNCLDRLKH